MAESVELRDTETSQTGRVKAGINFKYKPVRGLSLGLSPEIYVDAFNFDDGVYKNNTPLNRLNLNFDIGYKACKYFKVHAGYTLLAKYCGGNKKSDYNNYFELKHRVDVDATGILHYERWTFSLRERFRVTFRPDSSYYNPKEELFAAMELRTRFKVEYKCFSKPLKPFFYIEMDNPLNQNQYVYENLKVSDYWLRKMIYRIGLDWKLDGYSTLTFYYAFEHGKTYDVDLKSKGTRVILTPELQLTHQIGIYYTLEF